MRRFERNAITPRRSCGDDDGSKTASSDNNNDNTRETAESMTKRVGHSAGRDGGEAPQTRPPRKHHGGSSIGGSSSSGSIGVV
jgi:hypothetical protein